MAVVGAGPVGLTLALSLARFGVRSMVLEAQPWAAAEGSKSICVQRDVLEIFERLGLGRRMAAEGVAWVLGRTYYRSTELFQTRFPETGQAAFPPFVNLPQYRVDALLLEAARASGLVDVRFGHRVADVAQDAGGVVLGIDGPAGVDRLTARYAVGCDGARSTVRHTLGVEFPGYSFDDRFLIADVRAKLPFPSERRFYFEPRFNPGRQVLLHPQPDDVWRIDWQVPPDVDVEAERASGGLDRRIRAVIGDVPYELVWLSTYRFHQRAAERFRVGRAFLAGDAAHLMSPFGARGMNSGVADADNLAWKLWGVLAGWAPATLLDSYEPERRAAARENLRVTGDTMRFMVPPSATRRLLRRVLLRGSVYLPALRRRVDSGKLATPFTYDDSPIVAPDPTAMPDDPLRPGALAPDAPCRVPGDKRVGRLRDLLGGSFVGLYLPRDEADARRFAPQGAFAEARVPVRSYVAVPASPGPLPPGVLLDEGARLAAAYGDRLGTLWVIRPDGHIAARREGVSGADLAALAERAAGYRPAPAQASAQPGR